MKTESLIKSFQFFSISILSRKIRFVISVGRHMLWLHDYLRLCGDCNDDELLHFLNTHCSFFFVIQRTMWMLNKVNLLCFSLCHLGGFLTTSGAEQFLTHNKWASSESWWELPSKGQHSVVTGPQGEEKGKLRKPNIWFDCAAPFFLLAKCSQRPWTDASNHGTCGDGVGEVIHAFPG